MLTVFITTMIGFIKVKESDGNSKSNRMIKILTMIGLFMGCICPWASLTLLKLRFEGNNLAGNFVALVISSYAMNIYLILLVFGMRIINTFKNTKHAMSIVFKVWLFTLSIIMCIIFCIAIITEISKNENRQTTLSALVAGLGIIFSVLNGMILLVIFIEKLNKVIGEFLLQFGAISNETIIKLNMQLDAALSEIEWTHVTTSSSSSKVNNISDHQDKNKNKNKDKSVPSGLDDGMVSLNKIIHDMSKFTILITIAMTSSTLFAIILQIIRGNDLAGSYLGLCAGIDILVNDICLILQFKFARKYYKLLCKCCILQCEKRQTKGINNNVRNTDRKMVDANGQGVVELKVLRGGGIGVESVDLPHPSVASSAAEVQENNQVAGSTMKSIEMQNDI